MQDWRQIQRNNFKNIEKLSVFLEWDQALYEKTLKLSKFPLNLPQRLAEKIKKNTLDDPILLQFVPLKKELLINPHFNIDPVNDKGFQKGDKLLQKYEGRALILSTSACAMNCRYCFRKNFAYETQNKGFNREIELIKADSSLSEVILSGGDPLSLSDPDLFTLMDQVAEIPHVKRLRFHTRFPIGIPERISNALIEKMKSYPLQIIFLIHVNHLQELDQEILEKLKMVQKLGIPIMTQTVLLKGVNDSVKALADLFLALIDNGIIPYYLHQLDQVQGAAHFEVEEEAGHKLMAELRALLPGYAIPRYVKEIAGEASKTDLTSSQVFLIPAC